MQYEVEKYALDGDEDDEPGETGSVDYEQDWSKLQSFNIEDECLHCPAEFAGVNCVCELF